VRVVFWSGMLPRNPSGKILKSELKKVFEKPQEQRA
jgi:acyl-coenzyme A synthetase/AMP-(fatty) acid ligase